MRFRFALVFAWAALIFVGSSFPNPPGASGGEWKYGLAHVMEYAILGALLFLAFDSYRRAGNVFVVAISAWAFATVYGMSDEFHQSFVPNRDANWLDVGFDSFGAALGIAATSTVAKLRLNRES